MSSWFIINVENGCGTLLSKKVGRWYAPVIAIPYRFYEVLYLKAFFLIDSGILNYQLSNNFENKESFVFENLEQLYSLINFYLKHDDEREFLLSTLLKSFEKIYNPQKHGKEIFDLLFNN